MIYSFIHLLFCQFKCSIQQHLDTCVMFAVWPLFKPRGLFWVLSPLRYQSEISTYIMTPLLHFYITLLTCVWSEPIVFSTSLWRETDTLGSLLFIVGLWYILHFNGEHSPKITSVAPPNMACDPAWSLLRRALLLREDPENELSLLMRFKGRGDDGILPWGQTEPLRDLPQVNVGLAFSLGGCVQEEVLLQMLILSTHLWLERNQRKCGNSNVNKKNKESSSKMSGTKCVCFCTTLVFVG